MKFFDWMRDILFVKFRYFFVQEFILFIQNEYYGIYSYYFYT